MSDQGNNNGNHEAEIAVMKLQIADHGERLDSIEHTYYGNGKMGDRTKVAIIWYSYTAVCTAVGTALGFLIGKFFG